MAHKSMIAQEKRHENMNMINDIEWYRVNIQMPINHSEPSQCLICFIAAFRQSDHED